jgi:uncharacterized phiE125 gp8 family phage protein
MMPDAAPAMMPAVLVPPAREPVTATEVATHSRLRLETAAELQHVELLIRAARRSVELYLRRSLITQTRRYVVDRWPAEELLYVPWGPVQTVESVVYRTDGGPVTWDQAAYETLVWPLEPGAVVAKSSWPPAPQPARAGIEVTYTAGYGDDAADVPEMFRLAILLVVGDYLEHREATVFQPTPPQSLAMPSGIEALLSLDRDWFHYGK